MNNQELELKIKEILSISNFFDMIESAIAFEKEYKNSDFYKKTKISLMEVIKEGKLWYKLSLEGIGAKIQDMINNLDLSNVNNILEELGNVYAKENEETLSIFKEFQNIVK
jgi:hypothetical protein